MPDLGVLLDATLATPTEQHDRLQRSCRTAGSWFRRAAAIMRATDLPSVKDDEGRDWSLRGYEAGRLLYRVLGEARPLVDLLNDSDDELEDIERFAKDLVSALKRRRLARAMENDSGRTDEEKAAFAEARERLRAK